MPAWTSGTAAVTGQLECKDLATSRHDGEPGAAENSGGSGGPCVLLKTTTKKLHCYLASENIFLCSRGLLCPSLVIIAPRGFSPRTPGSRKWNFAGICVSCQNPGLFPKLLGCAHVPWRGGALAS